MRTHRTTILVHSPPARYLLVRYELNATKVLMPKDKDTHTLTCLIGATQLPDTSLTTEEGEVKREFQFISLDNSSKCRISLVYSLAPRP